LAREGDLVSELRARLVEQLARFDDAAFAALANRGLLRRAQKDLEKQRPEILEESDDAIIVGFGSHRIRFDARGPAFAECSCPTAGVCQHILAAAIGLRQRSLNPSSSLERAPPRAGGPAESATPPVPDPLATLHDSLITLSAAQLSKHAGKAGYRWAWQFVQDLGSERQVVIGGERYILIGFTHPRVNFRFMGGGVDGLIADVQIGQIEKYRVAAVLAYQRANGIELSPPEPPGKHRAGHLDLGKDHALPESAEEAGYTSRARLRVSVSQLLQESVTLGLSHLSQGIQERYATLAVWAQGAEYHRLAMLLRRIADHVDMLLERSGAADEHRLFDEMTLAYALVCALEQAAVRNVAPAYLVGRARTRYEQAATLELIGLGASAWRSAAGYIGLTMLFWSVSDSTFVSCTDARPEIQRGFDPRARYKAAGPWSGLGSPAQTPGRRLVLTGAQLNAQGRVSAAESTTATVQPYVGAAELCQLLKPSTNWGAALRARSLSRRSLLAEPSPMKDWAVLQPARFGTPRFDVVRQIMEWPIFDDEAQRLNLELPYSTYSSYAIERVEGLQTDPLPDGALVIARLGEKPGQPVAEPLSLVRPDADAGTSAVDTLQFDPAPARSSASRWLAKLRRHPIREGPRAEPGGTAVPAALRDMRQWLRQTAERGISQDRAESLLSDLRLQAKRTNAAGLSTYSHLRQGAEHPAAALLRHHYVCMQYERLLVDDVDEVA
jgi:hypothetical protein